MAGKAKKKVMRTSLLINIMIQLRLPIKMFRSVPQNTLHHQRMFWTQWTSSICNQLYRHKHFNQTNFFQTGSTTSKKKCSITWFHLAPLWWFTKNLNLDKSKMIHFKQKAKLKKFICKSQSLSVLAQSLSMTNSLNKKGVAKVQSLHYCLGTVNR